jgi:hypothetical protein
MFIAQDDPTDSKPQRGPKGAWHHQLGTVFYKHVAPLALLFGIHCTAEAACPDSWPFHPFFLAVEF